MRPHDLALLTKVGDLGIGFPPQFFKFDGKVDASDLVLFIKCYKGLGPRHLNMKMKTIYC